MWLKGFLWSGSWVKDIFWLGPGLNVESQLPCPGAAAFISQDASGWGWRVRCPKRSNVPNPTPSLCHTTTQCHEFHSIAHHKLPWESVLHISQFLPGEPRQQDPCSQHELLQGESWGWAGLTAHPVSAALLAKSCWEGFSLSRRNLSIFHIALL